MYVPARRHTASRVRQALIALPLVGMLWVIAAAAPVGAASLYRDCSGTAFAAGADLHRCDLADSTVIGMDLHGINLARSDLSRSTPAATRISGRPISRALDLSRDPRRREAVRCELYRR